MMQSKPKGAVAAGHEITVRAAADVLQLGGNAFDAILAALFASCVCEPVLSSLGGGGFLMAHQVGHAKTTLFDFFVQTPKHKRQPGDIEFKPIVVDFGNTQQKFQIGMGASATPGFVSGCYEVHAALCTLPMEVLLQPAIAAAENGLLVNDFQARLFKIVEPILLNTTETRALFAPEGELLSCGDVFRNPQLANTLKSLADKGPDFFYNGYVRDEIVDLARRCGGHLLNEDFRAYETRRRCPLVQPFGKYGEVFLNPSPSAGGCLIGFGLALAQRLEAEGGTLDGVAVAKIVQTIDHSRQEIFEDPELMLCEYTIANAVAALQNQTVTAKGTTHISIIDAEGNAASATVSNGEGNGRMVGDLGFMLNNMLGEEDLNPGGFHRWPCDVRLSSMMAPTLVDNGAGTFSVLGSGGSNRIRSAMVQVLLRLRADVPVTEAVSAARLHFEDGHLDIEDWMDEATLKALVQNHSDARLWETPNMFFGGVHMVQKMQGGQFDGAGDLRRDGRFLVVH